LTKITERTKNMHIQGENIMPDTEFEVGPKFTFQLLGNLEDFGLGNDESGIPSELAEATELEKQEYGEKLIASIDKVTDLCHYGCIDGRFCIHNHDESDPEVRLRQVGGTGLIIEVALDSASSVLDTIKEEDRDNLPKVVNGLEDYYEKITGVKRSAHTGNCGGVLGAVKDGDPDALPAAFNTVEAIMAIPEVINHTKMTYDKDLANEVATQAPRTAQWLKEHDWDGNTYVEGVTKDEPAGVEDLEVDVNDHAHHGHKEPALVLFLNTNEDERFSLSEAKMKALGINSPFVVNLDASYDMAKALSGQDGERGATKAFIANLKKHVMVANRLPSRKTPVYFMMAA